MSGKEKLGQSCETEKNGEVNEKAEEKAKTNKTKTKVRKS